MDLHLPEHPGDFPDWLAAGAAEAVEVFAATDLDAPMWAWGVDQHARFWVRRMLFETLVHRVDAQLALGLSPHVDRVLAVDGIDEFLTNLPFASPFAPLTAQLRAPDRTIRFTCTDGDGNGNGDWLIRLRPDGFALVADGTESHAADAAVRGTARRPPAAPLRPPGPPERRLRPARRPGPARPLVRPLGLLGSDHRPGLPRCVTTAVPARPVGRMGGAGRGVGRVPA